MKNSIKLTALFLLASTGLFAATTVKAAADVVPAAINVITFSALPSHAGVQVKIDGATTSKAVVIVYDQDKNVIFKDVLPKYKAIEKGYILNKLENGDYVMEVTANSQVVKRDIHVYDEYKTKVFIVKQ